MMAVHETRTFGLMSSIGTPTGILRDIGRSLLARRGRGCAGVGGRRTRAQSRRRLQLLRPGKGLISTAARLVLGGGMVVCSRRVADPDAAHASIMHHDALPLGHHAVVVPAGGVGTDLAFLGIQLPGDIARQRQRVGREQSELPGPLARPQPLHLGAKLVRFLLHPRQLIIEQFPLLHFPGEGSSDLELPHFPSRVLVKICPILECQLEVSQTHFLVLLRIPADHVGVHAKIHPSRLGATGGLSGQLVRLPLFDFRADGLSHDLNVFHTGRLEGERRRGRERMGRK